MIFESSYTRCVCFFKSSGLHKDILYKVCGFRSIKGNQYFELDLDFMSFSCATLCILPLFSATKGWFRKTISKTTAHHFAPSCGNYSFLNGAISAVSGSSLENINYF
jgi:hypothetical protein